MLLSPLLLDRIGSVNDYISVGYLSSTAGDAFDFYFQLVDLTKNSLRYLPATGSTMQVVIDNIDNDVRITRFASQPFPQDASIWKVSILNTDTVSGTCALRITLTEPLKVTRGALEGAFRIRLAGTL